MKNERNEIDLVLLSRYADGDEGAFYTLYEYYAPLLRNWAVAMFNGFHRDSVDDIVQEVFSDFHARRHEAIHHVQGYLHNSLHYRLVNYKIACMRQKRSPTRERRGYEAIIYNDPADQAEQNETARLLRDLVANLPERERLCVNAYMAGYSCHEYAAKIRTHFNNVKRWTREGLTRLREHYSCQPQD